MAGEWDMSPGNDCCCVFCSGCGEDVDRTSVYELSLTGMANCDPIAGQACDDCPDYDGVYIVEFDRVLSLSSSLRRCIYQHVFEEETCDNGGYPPELEAHSNIQVVRLEYEYIGDTDTTVLRAIIESYEQKPDPFSSGLAPIVVKAHFSRTFNGVLSCEDVVELSLPRTPGITPCGNNTACDWTNATMTVNYLGTV